MLFFIGCEKSKPPSKTETIKAIIFEINENIVIKFGAKFFGRQLTNLLSNGEIK